MSLYLRIFNRNSSESTNRSSRYAYSAQTRRFKEKNVFSAMLGTATIVVLCASLVEPVWFRLEGGKCCRSYLGVNTFFGSLSSQEYKEDIVLGGAVDCDNVKQSDQNLYQYCINAKSLTLIQVIIVFCILSICSSLFSFILDIIAPRKKPLWKILKRYSFGYIFTVLLCATTVGFCYWASQEIYNLQYSNKQFPGSPVKVTFDTGVYLVTAAGGIAIVATASNLMRQYPTEEEEQADRLMDEDSDEEADASWANIARVAGPPPYAP